MTINQGAISALIALILVVASIAFTGSWLAPLILLGLTALGAAILCAAYIGIAASQVGNDRDAIMQKIKTCNDGVTGFFMRIASLALMTTLIFLLAPRDMAVPLVVVYLVVILTTRLTKWFVKGRPTVAAAQAALDLANRTDRDGTVYAQRTGDWADVSDRDHAAYKAAARAGLVDPCTPPSDSGGRP